MSKDVECPYCGEWQEICHDDGQGYQEDVKHSQECSHCGKAYVFTTSISFYYEAEKADCLNGDKHKYELTATFPRFGSKMRCSICDDERELTEEERSFHLVETYAEYVANLKRERDDQNEDPIPE